MLRKIIGDRCVCGLDIGGQSIKAAIIKRSHAQGQPEGTTELLGVFETRTAGFRKASVTDLNELSECIHQTVTELTKKTGIKFKEVELGLGGEIVDKRFSTAVVPLMDRGSKIITQRDIRRVEQQAGLLGVSIEETMLHHFPQYFKVDDVNIAINPIGMYGRKLEVNTLLIVVNNTLLQNLTKAVNQAGYEVDSISFTSYASAMLMLEEQQKRQGCALIDIGASTTQVLIFKEAQLRFLNSIPLGGEHVTGNVSSQLNLAFELAEDIKQSYAYAMGAEVRNQEEVLIKRDEGYLPVKKATINEAVEPVIGHLVDAVINILRNSGMYDQISGGIVMTGGGALLPGLPERIEKATNLPVRVGKVALALKSLTNAAKYSSVLGVAQLALKRGADPLQAEVSGGLFARLSYRVKELYQEYF